MSGLSLKKGWGAAYEYLSEEDSRLYDRAIKGEIAKEEANAIIAKMVERIQASCRGSHESSKY
jgi:hypothetical protein